MSPVITIALPVFSIIAAGMAAGRLGWMSGSDAQVLNKYVFRFAMPAALFGLTASTAPPGADDFGIVIAYGAASLVAIFGGYLFSRRFFSLSPQEAGAHGFASVLGNAVFLGLPIALTIEGWARPFVMLMLIEGTIIIAIGAALMAPRRADGNFLMRFAGFLAGPFRNPLVIGMALGFIYSALGFSLTGPFETFFSLLGRAAGPTALFSLGLFLATNKFPAFGAIAGRVTSIGLFKMALLPAIAIAIAYALGVTDTNQWGALALFLFVPTGVGAFIIANQHSVYSSETASAVAVTTLLSVVTISVVLVVFA